MAWLIQKSCFQAWKKTDYPILCSQADTFAFKAKADEEAEKDAAEKRRIELEEKVADDALTMKLARWNDSRLEMLSCIEVELKESCHFFVVLGSSF
jgi:hypothetical protein